MKLKFFTIVSFFALMAMTTMAQQVEFEEYDLANGLHVILHQDNTAPVVTTSVMYHVGAKNEKNKRSGFAHFFEHLLFEGTKNIGRGEWSKIVNANGGYDNASTTDDRTYYFETFPSNNVELGLWMEAERMLHPIINKIGVDTQNEVVKEEKRLHFDNQPYGHFLEQVKLKLFSKHPYQHTTIGSMADLDAATLDEFLDFNHMYYAPNNATLVVAGDIDIAKTKAMVAKYFTDIPKGKAVAYTKIEESPITQEIKSEYYDPNIQIPALVAAYRTPSMKEHDAYVLDMISTLLSDGKSSRMYKQMVDVDKKALQVGAINLSQEDYGMYIVYALPMGKVSLDDVLADMETQIKKVQTELISEKEYQKLQNKFENNFVNANSSIQGIANSLARYQMLYGNTNLINDEIKIYRSITREEIRDVAKKYLNTNQRLVLKYLPKAKEDAKK
ncbi:MAG: insulinase family protein [Flavobacteriaceae bacterium]|nr:insulinase family protein [Flavobacteriaceae bacterium]